MIEQKEEAIRKRWEQIVADANQQIVTEDAIVDIPREALPDYELADNIEKASHEFRKNFIISREQAIEKALDTGESAERDDRTTMDKVIQMNVGIKPSQLILPTGLTEDKIKTWTANYLESSKPGWMFERIDDREGKIFAKPVDFAVLGGNQLIMTGGDTAYSRNFDVGLAIYNEIENHGRTTPDELANHIQGVNVELLFIVVNMMLVKDYITWYTEADGTRTLELVDNKVRDARIAIRNSMNVESLVYMDEESRYFLTVLPPYTAAW